MLNKLRWLHLSDFHCCEKDIQLQKKALESLLEDIREKYTTNEKPDLIFITGDITFSGKKEEFNIAQNFVDKLRDVYINRQKIHLFCAWKS